MRIALIVSLIALLACITLMFMSYSQSVFWNVLRRPSSANQDSITFVQSVVGYLKFGSYSIEDTIPVPLGMKFDGIKSAHEGFRFYRVRSEHGFLSAIFLWDESHVDSRFVSIHYTAILLPICIIAGTLIMSIRRRSTVTLKRAEQGSGPQPPDSSKSKTE